MFKSKRFLVMKWKGKDSRRNRISSPVLCPRVPSPFMCLRKGIDQQMTEVGYLFISNHVYRNCGTVTRYDGTKKVCVHAMFPTCPIHCRLISRMCHLGVLLFHRSMLFSFLCCPSRGGISFPLLCFQPCPSLPLLCFPFPLPCSPLLSLHFSMI